jgi:hypothetical protein
VLDGADYLIDQFGGGEDRFPTIPDYLSHWKGVNLTLSTGAFIG